MEKRLTVPNVLSGIRLLTIPVIVLLILYTNVKNFPILIAVYFFSLGLDFFDGYLARKLRQESDLGKILDPLADKLMVFGVIAALVIKSDFPLWLAIVIIARDLLIVTAGTVIFKGKHVVTTSILIGKVTFALLGALLMVYIVDLSQLIDLEILKRFFIVLSVGFLAWSMLGYYEAYLKIREKND